MGKWVTSKVFCSKRDRCFKELLLPIYVFLAGVEVSYVLRPFEDGFFFFGLVGIAMFMELWMMRLW
jgi:hypothetical protein